MIWITDSCGWLHMHWDDSLWNCAAYSPIGAHQPGSKAVGALDTPQPWTPPDMGGGDRTASKVEAQEVVTSIPNVPEE